VTVHVEPVSPLKKAAAVILLRETPADDFEVFLLKRSEQSSFMAGLFVYPGGRIEKQDWEMASPFIGTESLPSREWAAAGNLPSDEFLALRVCAIRELFEEAGVLLAHQTGLRHTESAGIPAAGLLPSRDSIVNGHRTFTEMLSQSGLATAVDSLCYYAHWITPEAFPIRFDTHFFLAHHPADQEAVPDLRETTQGIWQSPRKAAAENLTGRIPLSPPTLKILEHLARFTTVREILGSLPATPVQPVLPVLLQKTKRFIVFPDDGEYEACLEGSVDDYDDHGRSSGLGNRTTCVLYSDGKWLPFDRNPR
jgi:8-oxo-dGTP pyrophosphatase MutT (NUDIX family)